LFKSSQATLITIGPPATHMLKNWYSIQKQSNKKLKPWKSDNNQQPENFNNQPKSKTQPQENLWVFFIQLQKPKRRKNRN